MDEYKLHFSSVTSSIYGREVPFTLKIECANMKDAILVGNRLANTLQCTLSYVERTDVAEKHYVP